MRRPRKADGAVFAVSAAVTLVFFIDFCGLLFQCGCRSWWAGAADHCNIHTAGVHHCPWCVMALGWQLATLGAILSSQAASALLLPARWPWYARLAGAVAAFPVSGAALGAVAGICFKYWN